jgi:hypothetical protein
VLDQVAELRPDRHGVHPAGDHRLAIADGDDLLALEGQEQQADHLPAGSPGVPAARRG